jgi:hypothetical protein
MSPDIAVFDFFWGAVDAAKCCGCTWTPYIAVGIFPRNNKAYDGISGDFVVVC